MIGSVGTASVADFGGLGFRTSRELAEPSVDYLTEMYYEAPSEISGNALQIDLPSERR